MQKAQLSQEKRTFNQKEYAMEQVNYLMRSGNNVVLGSVEDQWMKIPITPQTITMLITPPLAASWLVRNTHNRPLSKRVVAIYVRDILAGQWKVTGESIKFDRIGVLLDGQHRLAAIVESNVSITSDVRFGLDPETFVNIDTHRKRIAADVLSISGETNANSLAAALGAVLNYERGWYKSIGHGNYTHYEILDALARHPLIRLSLEKGRTTKDIAPMSISTALHYLATQVDKDKADLFWEQLSTGIGLEATSPVLMLRNRLLDLRMTAKKRGHLRTAELAALIIKAFNLFVQGYTAKVLNWRSQGLKAEAFPTFITVRDVQQDTP